MTIANLAAKSFGVINSVEKKSNGKMSANSSYQLASPITLECKDVTKKLVFKDEHDHVHVNSHKKTIRELIGSQESSYCQIMNNDLLLFGGYNNHEDSHTIRRLYFHHNIAELQSHMIVDELVPTTKRILYPRAQAPTVLRHGPHVDYPELIVVYGICSSLKTIPNSKIIKKENDMIDSNTCIYKDIWSFSLKEKKWQKIDVDKRVKLPGRSEHACVYLAAYDSILIYGGRTQKQRNITDMLLFSCKTKQFTKLPQNFFSSDERERLKTGRKAHTLHLYNDSKVVLICGHNENNPGYHSDILEYDVGLHRWRLIVDLSKFGFTARSFHQSALVQDNVLIYGGCWFSNLIDDQNTPGYHWVDDTFWIVNMHNKTVQKILLNGMNPHLTGHCLYFPNENTLMLVGGSHESKNGATKETISKKVYSIDLSPLKDLSKSLSLHLKYNLEIFRQLIEDEKEALAERGTTSHELLREEEEEEQEQQQLDQDDQLGGVDFNPIEDASVLIPPQGTLENNRPTSPEILSEHTPHISVTPVPLSQTRLDTQMMVQSIEEDEGASFCRCFDNLLLDSKLRTTHSNAKLCTEKRQLDCDILFLNRIPNLLKKLNVQLQGRVVVTDCMIINLSNYPDQEDLESALELIVHFLYNEHSKQLFSITRSPLLIKVVKVAWYLGFYNLIQEMINQYKNSRMLCDVAAALNEVVVSGYVDQNQKGIYEYLESFALQTIQQNKIAITDLPLRLKQIVEQNRVVSISRPKELEKSTFPSLKQYLANIKGTYFDYELMSMEKVAIPCHRSVLLARSPFLCRNFDPDCILQFHTHTENLIFIINYLYAGIMPKSSVKQFLSFVRCAVILEVPTFSDDVLREFTNANFDTKEVLIEIKNIRKQVSTEPWLAEIIKVICSHLMKNANFLMSQLIYSLTDPSIDKEYNTLLQELFPSPTLKRKTIQVSLAPSKKQRK